MKDVKLVVRPYKTRTAFTNLSSPPTIYLNEYLIDDEEIPEYLILRELIHISLHMYPPTRYTGGLSYAEKSDSVLHFFIPKEKVEEIRDKDGEKTDRGEHGTSMTSFSSSAFLLCPAESSSGGRRRSLARGKRDLLAGTSLQALTHRSNYSCKSVPVDVLLRPFRRTTGRPLLPPRGISWRVFLWLCICRSLPVESKAYIAKQKEETWIGSPPRRLTRYGVEQN